MGTWFVGMALKRDKAGAGKWALIASALILSPSLSETGAHGWRTAANLKAREGVCVCAHVLQVRLPRNLQLKKPAILNVKPFQHRQVGDRYVLQRAAPEALDGFEAAETGEIRTLAGT